MTRYVELDVRPILRAGGEPFAKIMETVASLQDDEGLRLFATFEPTPLLRVLETRGYRHATREIGGGDWQVDFTPAATPAAAGDHAVAAPATHGEPDDAPWPEPVQRMDNRDLDPPEPMVRILAATEAMASGEVLSALLCREPLFLFPELAKRGHRWRGGFEADGRTYKVLVRVGAGGPAA
jgi:uncharacterized protein (DUF2249 family)